MADRLPRKLAAILYADVAGYSRLMGEDEDTTHQTVSGYLDLASELIRSHQGKVMHFAGDAILARFDALVDALSAAVAIQSDLKVRNKNISDDRKVQFRIGVNTGDVIEDRGDIYGDGVNVAARLEALSEPGGICVSDAVRTAVGKKLSVQYTFIGEHNVKNIKEPVRAYRVFEDGASAATAPLPASVTHAAGPRPPFGKPSLAIKPFEDIGSDAESNRLADAFSNGIAVALTRVPSLVMVHDESPSMVETKQLTVQDIGERLRARYVLKGVVQKFGDRIRVNAELIDTSTNRYLWANNIDGELHTAGDIFRIQDEIIEEIVTALNVKLLAGEAARIVRKALKDPDALERYYRGEELLWHSSMKLELQEAHRLFEETIQLEPDSPVGYAAAALTHWVEAISGLSDSAELSLARATDLAQQAIRLNDVTGYAHMVLAHVYLTRREFDEAMSEATQAVTYRPSCPASYAIKASVLTYLGKPSEAVDFAEYALQLTPVHPPMYPAVLASAYYGCERYYEAIAAAKDAIDLQGKDVSPHVFFVASAVALGRTDEAKRGVEDLLQINRDFQLADFAESQPYRQKDTLNRLIDRLHTAGLS
jgi:adenylate cyclase